MPDHKTNQIIPLRDKNDYKGAESTIFGIKLVQLK